MVKPFVSSSSQGLKTTLSRRESTSEELGAPVEKAINKKALCSGIAWVNKKRQGLVTRPAIVRPIACRRETMQTLVFAAFLLLHHSITVPLGGR